MWSIIHQQLVLLIKEHDLVKNSNILLALSGGQDSLCLLQIFKDIQIEYIFSIDIIHFNHQWRIDATQNMFLIAQLSMYLKMSRYLYTMPVGIMDEMTSRQWRYKLVYFLSIQKKYTMIMTAHTATDKAEVFFLNLLRGSPLETLISLVILNQLTSKLVVYRPLLFCNRSDIYWFCRKFFLPVWSDSTNYNYGMVRNRIREEFIPYLMQYFNLKIEKYINYIVSIIYNDYEYLQYIALYFYYRSRHIRFAALYRKIMIVLHSSIRYRILKILLKEYVNLQIYKKLMLLISHKQHDNNNIILRHIIYQDSCLIGLYIDNNWLYFVSSN
uniref:tRNA(Ile)-lysidine synthase n=1 Tax=Dixoniella grisea TaxID=35153 RepID=UPI001FCD72DA|nr:tRNA(Ile)-lysidine synthase [Dixoniella grisea]UNJ17193.1 tRNA(Ile)-lysidine synthase [Dixoniella grisea]